MFAKHAGHFVGISRGVEVAVGKAIGELPELLVLLREFLFDLGKLLLQGLAQGGDALALLSLGTVQATLQIWLPT